MFLVELKMSALFKLSNKILIYVFFPMNLYFTIKFKVPIMRAKLSSSNTWKDWVYQDYEITAPQANAGGNTGTAYITRLAGVLTWNGAIRSSSFARYTSSTSGGSVKSVDVQMGWSTGGLPETVSVINLHGDYIGA